MLCTTAIVAFAALWGGGSPFAAGAAARRLTAIYPVSRALCSSNAPVMRGTAPEASSVDGELLVPRHKQPPEPIVKHEDPVGRVLLIYTGGTLGMTKTQVSVLMRYDPER